MHIIWSCDYGCSKSFLLYAIYRLCCISGIRTSGSFEPVGSRLGRSSDTAELKSRKKERKQIEEQEEKEENLSVLRCIEGVISSVADPDPFGSVSL